MRIFRNPWGASTDYDAQRADLWAINLSPFLSYINSVPLPILTPLGTLSTNLRRMLPSSTPDQPGAHFYAQTVIFPEQKVTAANSRRDSRNYMAPDWDQAIDSVRINFIHDSPTQQEASKIATLLHVWRQLVRAGRGPLSSASGFTPGAVLHPDYYNNPANRFRIAFDIGCTLYRGSATAIGAVLDNGDNAPGAGPGLEVAAHYIIKNAWLASIQLTDLSYTNGNTLLLIQTYFYPEDIFPLAIAEASAGVQPVPAPTVKFGIGGSASRGLTL